MCSLHKWTGCYGWPIKRYQHMCGCDVNDPYGTDLSLVIAQEDTWSVYLMSSMVHVCCSTVRERHWKTMWAALLRTDVKLSFGCSTKPLCMVTVRNESWVKMPACLSHLHFHHTALPWQVHLPANVYQHRAAYRKIEALADFCTKKTISLMSIFQNYNERVFHWFWVFQNLSFVALLMSP